MRYLKILFILLFSLCIIPGLVSGIQLQHLDTDAHFSQMTVNGLYQDEYGVLWIGTKDGVKKYNGNRLESVNLLGVNNWIQSNFVPTICGDKKGHVYVNTDYHIIKYNLKQEKAEIIFRQGNTQTLPSLSFHYGINSLWIGLKDSIYNYNEKGVLLKYLLPRGDKVNISAMKESTDGKLYVGTKNSGVFCYDKGKRLKILTTNSEIISINEDSKKNIWIGTFNEGLFKIANNGQVSSYTTPFLSSNYVRAICEDDEGNIWVGTMLGLDIIHSKTGDVTHQGLAEKGKPGLSNLSVWILMKDDQGTMWVGTYYGGLDFYNQNKNIFNYYDLGFDLIGGPIVSKIVEDKRGVLWIGTEGNGLIAYDPKTARYTYYKKEQNTIPHNNIKSLFYDEDADVLWVGTHLGGLCSYDFQHKRFIRYTIDASESTKRSETVQALVKYKNILFIGTLSGVYYMDIRTGNIKKLRLLDPYIYAVNALIIDKKDNLWIGGNNLCYYDIKQHYIKSFDSYLSKTTQSPKNTITSLRYEKDKILIGTAGAGILIYNQINDQLHQINKKNSNISSDYISAVYPLSENYLLVAGTHGLSCIDIKASSSYNYDSQNGFALHSMIPGDIIRDSRKHLVMGGLNGMATVDEKSLFSKNFPKKFHFSKLWVNNKEVSVQDPTNILAQTLQTTPAIKLNHDENNIAIEIGNNNFVNLGQPQYQYILAGYDEHWIDFSSQSTIRYMNLPYGDYTLKVRNKLFGEDAASEEMSLGISVIPPLYATWYAYLIYLILTAAVAIITMYFYHSRLALSNSLELERRDKQQRDSINESKMRFLGNISHELKTPVTLISGQLELVLMSKRVSASVQNSLSEVHSRALKMNQLINELLDFLKYDEEKFKLKIEKHNIILFTREIFQSFESYAQLKKISFSFQVEESELFLWFDKIQLQKVFNNILSNAFKFTKEGGEIVISINSTESGIIISFKDSGIGIPADQINKIFERFFQVNIPDNNDFSNTGAGIGLSLSSNIVAAHQGKIGVISEERKGSVFTIELPIGKEHFNQNNQVDIVEIDSNATVSVIEILPADEEFMDDLIEEQKEIFKNQAAILIVEDDEELRRLLIKIFEPLFHIYEAENGEEAFKIAQLHSPDIILSDVMMVGVSGINLCTRIKSNFDTSHIPVVLLTALSGTENNIIGYNSGADDYINKPFDIRLLVTRCVTLLNNRRSLQESFKKLENNSIQQLTANPLDQNFINKAVKVIENNIESGNIDIGVLCAELAISRTKLFLKMKSITGQTPHDFIQNIKLKTAASMLRENQEHNISDIAYHLGFSSLNYFGKSFKDYFGMSPSAYRKSYLVKASDENP